MADDNSFIRDWSTGTALYAPDTSANDTEAVGITVVAPPEDSASRLHDIPHFSNFDTPINHGMPTTPEYSASLEMYPNEFTPPRLPQRYDDRLRQERALGSGMPITQSYSAQRLQHQRTGHQPSRSFDAGHSIPHPQFRSLSDSAVLRPFVPPLNSSNLVGSAIDDELSPTSSAPSSPLHNSYRFRSVGASWTPGLLAPPPADMYWTRPSSSLPVPDMADWMLNAEMNPTEALEHPLAQQQHVLQPPFWSPQNSFMEPSSMLYRHPNTSSLLSSDASSIGSASPNPSADWDTFSAHSPFSAGSPFGGSQLEDPETQGEVQQDHNDDSPKTSSSNETERGLERQQDEYLNQDLARLLQLGGDENSFPPSKPHRLVSMTYKAEPVDGPRLDQTSSNSTLDPAISGQGSSTGMLPLPEGGPASYNNGDSILRAIVQSDAGRHASAARRKHKNRIAPYKCDICQADFTAKHNLRSAPILLL
ncbi:hypothetical protein R3P38DRAFT_1701614 [Favolaschia claudopus]|uniref:C2H2-type domain-containing protein n=1 Tax=Favolaschia claudopus TaxID=2862362 RepID=A0AAW0ABD0_9AGAR